MTTTTESVETRSQKSRRDGLLARSDLLVLWGGILFSLAFSALIWWTGQRLASVPHLPDTGPSWYYWKLPEATFWSRATSWGFYLAHQLAAWGLIYVVQKQRPRHIAGLHWFNGVALAGNAFFIVLHLVQTQIWYDGIAQDVSIWSSQGSVIVLLVWILLMENSRRGMFFGKKLPIGQQTIRFARKYHGYFFAWATIYTFWYHPMEPTSGHLIGFFYMFLLLLQGSLFYTRVHTNRWWTVTLEVAVLAHGALVAVMQGNALWPMFAFGFGGIFVITQMHGLGLSRWVRWLILGLYMAAALAVYGANDITMIHQITWIPIIEYLAVLLLAGIFGAGLWLAGRVKRWQLANAEGAEA
jgi:hypothetical protein